MGCSLESLAIEGYRSGSLSYFEASQLLGMSRLEFDGFLKEHSVFEHAYSADDLDEDVRNFEDVILFSPSSMVEL